MTKKNKISSYIVIVSTLPLLLISHQSEAHALGQRLGDFYGGFLHPILVLGHVLPLMALSILAGQQGAATGRTSLYLFIGSLLVGSFLATHLPKIDSVIFVNKISLVITGLLVALHLGYARWLILSLVVFFGLTHGYENGLELSSSEAPILFTIGILCGGLLLFSWFSALTISVKNHGFQIALRVLGSWVAAVGILIIGLTV